MFYVIGEGWSGKFTHHVNTEYGYHLRWRSVHHRHNTIQFQTFKSEHDLEQFMDDLDRDFHDLEPMKLDDIPGLMHSELIEEMAQNGE